MRNGKLIKTGEGITIGDISTTEFFDKIWDIDKSDEEKRKAIEGQLTKLQHKMQKRIDSFNNKMSEMGVRIQSVVNERNHYKSIVDSALNAKKDLLLRNEQLLNDLKDTKKDKKRLVHGLGKKLDAEKTKDPCATCTKLLDMKKQTDLYVGLERDKNKVLNEEIEKLIPVFNEFPSSGIIFHPRGAKQSCSGEIIYDAYKHAVNNYKQCYFRNFLNA